MIGLKVGVARLKHGWFVILSAVNTTCVSKLLSAFEARCLPKVTRYALSLQHRKKVLQRLSKEQVAKAKAAICIVTVFRGQCYR